MTEAEWTVCTDIYTLLEYLRGKASDRKLRLFAVACCRRPYYQVADERHRKAVQLAERMADEDVDKEEWKVVHQAAYQLWQEVWAASLAAQQKPPREPPEVESLMDADTATAAGWAILEDGWEAAYQVTGVQWHERHADEPGHQLALLRDIFDNPFRLMAIDLSWPSLNGGIVVKLAQSIYQERAFYRLPILADSIENAGCHDADILGHCRQPGEHVRGCWVVDMILGKK